MPETSSFKYSILANKPDCALITLGKNVQGGSEALVFSSILDELIEKGVKRIIIDMKEVELINSSGLGMLVSGLSSTRKRRASLMLASAPQKVIALLEMTHLDKVFKIYRDEEEAAGVS